VAPAVSNQSVAIPWRRSNGDCLSSIAWSFRISAKRQCRSSQPSRTATVVDVTA
jgi:hypothetical protein